MWDWRKLNLPSIVKHTFLSVVWKHKEGCHLRIHTRYLTIVQCTSSQVALMLLVAPLCPNGKFSSSEPESSRYNTRILWGSAVFISLVLDQLDMGQTFFRWCGGEV
ncbi:hypothetical protein AVEN_177594-1 [Araneus ventricosus]|uniref:Uncharacterized protein n=1 Tax=Araneus ventricosus TaxID=182803 RepID=A0A4Y2M1Q8_ARAVE|nr:hypothetical protein AVEN_177581-1 [Araneus ventricosus]GBN20970.1 hypothetical protein AVEN_177594-1 [Araneus ventricosus]